ncbi:MAG TPA: hypothetical protein VLA17_06505 [Candidatus Limnocylindria bacterium]|nr:hypothetical protein [Candidatus Limnocylindria bacterium]
MDRIGEFVRHLFLELKPFIEWAISHWAMTLVALVALIYWSTRQKRLRRRHL